jgi:hypothetical protein
MSTQAQQALQSHVYTTAWALTTVGHDRVRVLWCTGAGGDPGERGLLHDHMSLSHFQLCLFD